MLIRALAAAVLFAACITAGFGCNRGAPTPQQERVIVGLAREYPAPEQQNFVKPRESAFEAAHGNQLVQHQPGSISFYQQLFDRSELRLRTTFENRNEADLDIKVTVESDFPAVIKREYQVSSAGKRIQLDLKDFDNTVVRITLSARSRNLTRLGGVLRWINPEIVSHKKASGALRAADLRRFRDRHAKDNVLLVVFDATNHRHVGAYGYQRDTTPAIDGIAAEGIVWKNAMTHAVSTLASTGSLLTGLMPEVHGVLVKPDALSSHFRTLPEYFRDAGYRTALFTGNPNASPAMGYGQGFTETWKRRQGTTVSAADFVEPFKSWIDAGRGRPFFGYVHFREPHEPYTPPEEWLRKFNVDPAFKLPPFEAFARPPDSDLNRIIDAYDANLAFGDSQFALMVAHLDRRKVLDNTILIILSDHGEAFWEHGKQGHNNQVYEESARIPMILSFPNEPALRGTVREEVTGTVDIFATLADLFPHSRKGVRLNGKSMLPILMSQSKSPADERCVISQTSGQAAYSFRCLRFKYIHYEKGRAGNDEFYDLLNDPEEKKA